MQKGKNNILDWFKNSHILVKILVLFGVFKLAQFLVVKYKDMKRQKDYSTGSSPTGGTNGGSVNTQVIAEQLFSEFWDNWEEDETKIVNLINSVSPHLMRDLNNRYNAFTQTKNRSDVSFTKYFYFNKNMTLIATCRQWLNSRDIQAIQAQLNYI